MTWTSWTGTVATIVSAAGLPIAGIGCGLSCPPTLSVPLGAATQVVNADTGLASRANSVWSIFASSPLSPLSAASLILARPPGFLFRVQFGPSGEILQVFDNEVLAPDRIGPVVVMDNAARRATDPLLRYVAESYGIEQQNAVGVVAYHIFAVGPFEVFRLRVELNGTINDLLGRFDGTLTFVVEPAFFAAFLSPAGVPAETVAVSGFANREATIIPPLIPEVPIP